MRKVVYRFNMNSAWNFIYFVITFLLQAIDKDADDQDEILFELVNETSSFSITKQGVLSVKKTPLTKTDTGFLMIMAYNSRSYSNSSLSSKTQKISVKVQVYNIKISQSIAEHCTSQSKFRYLTQTVHPKNIEHFTPKFNFRYLYCTTFTRTLNTLHHSQSSVIISRSTSKSKLRYYQSCYTSLLSAMHNVLS